MNEHTLPEPFLRMDRIQRGIRYYEQQHVTRFERVTITLTKIYRSWLWPKFLKLAGKDESMRQTLRTMEEVYDMLMNKAFDVRQCSHCILSPYHDALERLDNLTKARQHEHDRTPGVSFLFATPAPEVPMLDDPNPFIAYGAFLQVLHDLAYVLFGWWRRCEYAKMNMRFPRVHPRIEQKLDEFLRRFE